MTTLESFGTIIIGSTVVILTFIVQQWISSKIWPNQAPCVNLFTYIHQRGWKNVLFGTLPHEWEQCSVCKHCHILKEKE